MKDIHYKTLLSLMSIFGGVSTFFITHAIWQAKQSGTPDWDYWAKFNKFGEGYPELIAFGGGLMFIILGTGYILLNTNIEEKKIKTDKKIENKLKKIRDKIWS